MSVTLQRNPLSDEQAKKDFLMLVSDSRKSIQDAYSIECIVNHMGSLIDKLPTDEMQTYLDEILDCAVCIEERLEKYGFDFKPENPFEGE